MKNRIYLDYNATAPIYPDVIQIMTDVMQQVGNPSSVHGHGQAARKYIEDARAHVANLVNVKANQVIFNSGATEGLNTVLNAYRKHRILVSAIEHPAVLQCAPHAEHIPVTKDGIVDLNILDKMLSEGASPALVAVMSVNSETGVIQPVKEAADLAKKAGAHFLTDAVQAAGRIALNFQDLGIDYMVLSAHKMAGPQGVGALIYKSGNPPPSFLQGGGQENRRRAGTQNTAGIAGMGVAALKAQDSPALYKKLGQMRDKLEAALQRKTNKIIVYGQNAPRVGNTSNIGVSGLPAQSQFMALDLDGFSVSSGSACSSGAWKASHVLKAMGASEEDAKTALRISLGWATTKADLDAFSEAYIKTITRLSK
jgi:cysteine desulfurase